MAGTEPKAGTEPRTQDALNESRILVLGVQVLLGFQYSSVLEPAFASFPRTSQLLDLVALALLGIAFGLFAAPAPTHGGGGFREKLGDSPTLRKSEMGTDVLMFYFRRSGTRSHAIFI